MRCTEKVRLSVGLGTSSNFESPKVSPAAPRGRFFTKKIHSMKKNMTAPAHFISAADDAGLRLGVRHAGESQGWYGTRDRSNHDDKLKHRGLVVLWCPRLTGIAFVMINAWSVYQSQIVTIDFFQVSQPANIIKARDELLVTYPNVNERVSLAKSFGDDVLFIG